MDNGQESKEIFQTGEIYLQAFHCVYFCVHVL